MSLAQLFYMRESIRTRFRRWSTQKRLRRFRSREKEPQGSQVVSGTTPLYRSHPERESRFRLESLEPRLLLSGTPMPVEIDMATVGADLTVQVQTEGATSTVQSDPNSGFVQLDSWAIDNEALDSIVTEKPLTDQGDVASEQAWSGVQLIYLNLLGATDVDYYGPVFIADIDIPAFEAPHELQGQETDIIASLLSSLNGTFGNAPVSFTVQQPLNNIVRVAIQALAGVLGGTQSLHTDAYDEALALPTDRAALIALRTQQIIAEETGVANTVDPMGGSYFVEALTKKLEDGALDYFDRIDSMGGMVEAVEKGFPQREIQESAYQYQKALERGDQIIVGVNKYEMKNQAQEVPTLVIDESVRQRQLERLELTRTRRDSGAVGKSLDALRIAAQKGDNTMPATIEAVRAYATLGEICSALRDVYGIYEEPAI